LLKVVVLNLGLPVYTEFLCLKIFPLHKFQKRDCPRILAHTFGIGLLLLLYQNEETSPEGQRDKEIFLSMFFVSLVDGVGPFTKPPLLFAIEVGFGANGWGSSSLEILKVCSCADPGSSQLGTLVVKRCCRGFLEIYRVPTK
jgi:hypothetical protein